MTPTLLRIETEDFADAARRMHADVADPLSVSAGGLVRALQRSAAMAGNDPGGMAWAASYDKATAAALGATQDLVNASLRMSSMFAQSARNYEAADAASTAGARHAVTATLPRDAHFALTICVPSSAGGSGDSPHGWGMVSHLVGYVWPDGHQDRLRSTAAAWAASADVLDERSAFAAYAAASFTVDQPPEVDDMLTVCDAMMGHLQSLAGVHRALATACADLAGHIDDAHAEVRGELSSLLDWSAGIEGAGAVLSFFTFGLAEVPTQAAEVARIAAAAARIAAIIEKFAAMARTVAASVAAAVERAAKVAAELRAIVGVRLSAATVDLAARFRLVTATGELGAIGRLGSYGEGIPDFVARTSQLESKFKHARAFGVLEDRGRAGFEAFRSKVEEFLADPATTRIPGTYRGHEVILSYNERSRLVVVQSVGGEFISGWRLTAGQLKYVVEKGRLGGD